MTSAVGGAVLARLFGRPAHLSPIRSGLGIRGLLLSKKKPPLLSISSRAKRASDRLPCLWSGATHPTMLLMGATTWVMATPALLSLALIAACGSSSTTTSTGVILYTTPALCIGRAEAMGVCMPGGDAGGHRVGDCVTFTYDGTVGKPSSLRVSGWADPAHHTADCLTAPSKPDG